MMFLIKIGGYASYLLKVYTLPCEEERSQGCLHAY